MKYAPKKVFVLVNGVYEEITYSEFCDREENDESYKAKLFLPLYGMLMEVDKQTYDSYYKDKRRQKYMAECARANGAFSYDALDTEEFYGEDILMDIDMDVAEVVEHNIQVEKLRNVLLLLSTDECILVRELFVDEKTERELAKKHGISQVAIHKKKRRILEKLKKLLEK